MRRPATITCACGTVVVVKQRGSTPWRCLACAQSHKRARQRGEETPSRPSHLALEACDERELGPERPPYGMTAEEYSAWKAERAVHLYRTEPELSVRVIAERLDLSVEYVARQLRASGLWCRGDGRAELPSGLPAQ